MHLDDGVVGLRLGIAVRDGGRVLLTAGTVLTERFIEQLKRRGYLSVPIYDPLAPDAVPVEAIRTETRAAATTAVQHAIERVEQGGRVVVSQVRRIVDRILADIAANAELAYNLSSLRSLQQGTFTHSVNVGVYSLILASSLAIDRHDLRHLGVGAMLHDIGKVFYQDLVNKRGELTPEEYELIKRHAVDGYELLRRQHDIDLRAAHIAYQHHERLDGSGYPRGLAGDAVHRWARLVAVADVYDTLTADRPYGEGLPPHAAMAEVCGMAAAGKLEARVVRHLVRRLASFPAGTVLLLDSGEVAVSVGQTALGGTHPRVRVLSDAHLRPVEPVERVADGQAAETTVRAVLPDYPPRLYEAIGRS